MISEAMRAEQALNVHRCARTVYADNMAKSCSWLELRVNFKIKDTKIMQVIKDVMKLSYSNTENDFEIVKE
ncbi:hypothetical protein FQA39_LY15058 [Lamprigera yunnana]|nr:hypothetical protein FQA39_LY15058 [Lamprigera yunnana]